MKTVFSPSMCIHTWAQQTQHEGRTNSGSCNRGSVYFEGPCLYSYGRHYLMGLFFVAANGERVAVVNAESNSHTTNKHRSAAYRAIHSVRAYHLHLDSCMGDLLKGDEPNYSAAWSNVMGELADRLEKRERWSKILKADAAPIETLWEELGSWADLLGKSRDEFRSTHAARCDMLDLCLEVMAGNRAKANAMAKAKRERELVQWESLKPHLEAMQESWCNGSRFVWSDDARSLYSRLGGDRKAEELGLLPLMVRRKGEIAETSHGATVPWDAAVRLYKFCAAVKAKGERYAPNGLQGLQVGSFALREIKPNGDCQVGCHFLTFAELDLVAKREGVQL